MKFILIKPQSNSKKKYIYIYIIIINNRAFYFLLEKESHVLKMSTEFQFKQEVCLNKTNFDEWSFLIKKKSIKWLKKKKKKKKKKK